MALAQRIIPAMKQAEDPLSGWDSAGPRKIVAISFLAALFLAFLVLFPDLDRIYQKSSWLQNLSSALVVILGLCLAFLELRHSGEANEHRAEQNRLIEEANKYRNEANLFRKEANHLSGENNRLQDKTLALQIEVHELQASIEKKLTKVRLYVRAHKAAEGIRLVVSNLSGFDLWINQVELIVTEAEVAKLESRTIGGATLISSGHAEDGYKLYDAIVSINENRKDRIKMRFHLRVVATGVADDPVTIKSPEYQLTVVPGKIDLDVLRYTKQG
jgi:hypothetical protein